VLGLLAVACGDDSRDLDPYVSTESPGEALTELDYGSLDSSRVRLSLPWSGNTVSKDPAPDVEPATLSAVATESLSGYDRVVFTFRDRIPGYRLAYATEGGGGCDGAQPAGDAPAHLVVEFEKALSNEGGAPLVEDRDRAEDMPTLVGARQDCDEGDRVKWILAIRGEMEYRILEMFDEPRLVVDLRHP
jgi:hypothetical protein